MNPRNHFTEAVRIANFSSIALEAPHQLSVDSADTAAIVAQIRRYADLPYVFVVDDQRSAAAAAVVAALGAMRSPCYPYALFTVADEPLDIRPAEVDVIRIKRSQTDSLPARIAAYAAERLHFEPRRLQVGSDGPPPERVDVAIVGGGITGLYAANRLRLSGITCCILEKESTLGGIWTRFANTTSRVNTSEAAYRLLDRPARTNRDHSATREILEDMAHLADELSAHIFLQTGVTRIEKADQGYRIRYTRGGGSATLASKGVILAINDRVGAPREPEWDNQSAFRGTIVPGISDKARGLDWRGKRVVIVGMGAFAIENARTALEGGAAHVTVVCRRHGTVCPKIIDYLNFATPYDEAFKHDKKSNFRNMMYWKKMYEMSGATQPECWMGKVKHEGHTISVSDIWFVGHYLKKIATVTGAVTGMVERGVVVDGGPHIDADIVVTCIGFERNNALARSLCGYERMSTINYVDKDFMYLADAYIDDDAFNSFFGSSVLEMVKFYMEVFVRCFDSSRFEEILATPGVATIPLEDRRWSHYIAGAAALVDHHPELYAVARKQVDRRTGDFLEKHDLETYIAENKREWVDLHTLLNGKPLPESDRLPNVFEKLLPR